MPCVAFFQDIIFNIKNMIYCSQNIVANLEKQVVSWRLGMKGERKFHNFEQEEPPQLRTFY